MPIDALRARYFYLAADAATAPPTEPVPPTFDRSLVTPLLDMTEYVDALVVALSMVGTGATPVDNKDHFIFISNWLLGLLGGDYTPATTLSSNPGPRVTDTDPFDLDPGPVERRLIDLLKDKAKQGVDVRVLGWVSDELMSNVRAQVDGFENIAEMNAVTMNSIKALRGRPDGIPKGAMLNTIGHVAGTVHTKIVVVGNATNAVGFTGGLDFHQLRWSQPQHPGSESWHDVQAMVEGQAVQDLYDTFRRMWNENLMHAAKRLLFESIERPSYEAGTPEVPMRTLALALPPPLATGHHAQSLHTVPAATYHPDSILKSPGSISFAPNGLFEIKAAWRKAILAADTYIYIEDQSFWSQEVLQWVNTAIKAQPNLKVILVTSGEKDPADPEFDWNAIWTESINQGLLDGLSPMQIDDQVRMFLIWGDLYEAIGGYSITAVAPSATAEHSDVTTNYSITPTDGDIAVDHMAKKYQLLRQGANHFKITANPALAVGTPMRFTVENRGTMAPALGAAVIIRAQGITVHSKVTLIDDNWAMIGSANVTRRSLYTDLEHAISFVDEGETAVKEFRKQLWAEMFRSSDLAAFDSIQQALKGWEPRWFVPIANWPPQPTRGPGEPAPPYIDPVPLPIQPETMTPETRQRRDTWDDVDSRQPWEGRSQ